MPEPIPEPRESGFTKSTSAPLYWVRYGPTGKDPLVVLHGGPGADHSISCRRCFISQRSTTSSSTISVAADAHGPTIRNRSRGEDTLTISLRSPRNSPRPTYSRRLFMGRIARDVVCPRSQRVASGSTSSDRPAPFARRYRMQFEDEFRKRQQNPAIQKMRAELEASGLRESDPDAYRQRLFELSVAGYFAHPENARNLTPFRVIARTQQTVWDSLGDYDLFRGFTKSIVRR